MARQQRKIKNTLPAVFVFWEGESEQEYMKYMKNHFISKAAITVHAQKGVFPTADKAFKNNPKYKSISSEIDEIWLFFDTEIEMKEKWDEYFAIIKRLRKLNNHIRVRLLMTKACIEYFLLLHFKKTAPKIELPSDKEHIKMEVKRRFPSYEKGVKDTTWQIAELYKDAITNGKWSLQQCSEELPTLEETDERNRILFVGDMTFTTVHEALEFLESL
jgi:hypothetical protein